MGVAKLFLRMFLRKLKNRSGSTSIQIISKERGKYKVTKTIGTSNNEQEVQKLVFLAKQEIERLTTQSKLFISENNTALLNRYLRLLVMPASELLVLRLFSLKYTIVLGLMRLKKNCSGTW